MRGATVAAVSLASREHFNPRSSCEERLISFVIANDIPTFQSTLLMRGATTRSRLHLRNCVFQSTLLMRGATSCTVLYRAVTVRFQSTLLMRGATVPPARLMTRWHISIHAPHARSDMRTLIALSTRSYFNPRSSCEERLLLSSFRALSVLFQSTLLMRGATLSLQSLSS